MRKIKYPSDFDFYSGFLVHVIRLNNLPDVPHIEFTTVLLFLIQLIFLGIFQKEED